MKAKLLKVATTVKTPVTSQLDTCKPRVGVQSGVQFEGCWEVPRRNVWKMQRVTPHFTYMNALRTNVVT